MIFMPDPREGAAEGRLCVVLRMGLGDERRGARHVGMLKQYTREGHAHAYLKG
jgi:hypothetical protein